MNGGVNINIFCRAAVNTKLDVIKNAIKVADGTKTDIAHVDDQVTVLLFWASWCKVSMSIMDGFNKMLKDNKAKWGDKVRVIACSID